MIPITDTVKHLIIINVLMFFGSSFLLGERSYNPTDVWDYGRDALAMFPPTSEFFQPFQIVTHFFMHADMTHLLFNMFALYMFGSAMEHYWGAKKFLIYYLVTAFGAVILYWLTAYAEVMYFGGDAEALDDVPILGASGAVFGLLAAFGMTFPNQVIQLLFPPIPLKAKYFVLIYAGIELFLGLSRFGTGVAHFAHLGGALTGFLLILYWRKNDSGNRWA